MDNKTRLIETRPLVDPSIEQKSWLSLVALQAPTAAAAQASTPTAGGPAPVEVIASSASAEVGAPIAAVTQANP
jgi:hypothetical protein